MSGGAYFISDVHLGVANFNNKLQENVLIKFLEEEILNNAENLFIVGDLFDCWIEYRQVIQKGFYRVFSRLYDIVNNGIKVTYIAGNHDFWRSKYFKDEFGIEILDKAFIWEKDNKKFYIHHGDGLAYKDTGYKILKVILRSPISQMLYSLIHPDIGVWLAKKSSNTSRIHTSKKDYSIRDGLKDFAKQKISEGYDYVIMGHRHKPAIVKFGNGYYINLGDWMGIFSYGKFKDGTFKLLKFFDMESNTFLAEDRREVYKIVRKE
jgi:UDP-2,3-diacylglucosamine hydrolase